ncbi:phosphonopyruvate decarboxylase [candidate division KSB1 bacterium]|nr:phosphonopyruvate decarboxylase [candidate division KSB1 bacterium]
MINTGDFLELCLNRGFNFFTGTPCSYLKPIINYVISNDAFSFVNAANEGDAIALACGAVMAGKRSVVMFQNSGFGNAVNPLTSLSYTFKIPLLLIVTMRGEPSGPKDEPQHELMGKITTDILESMQIGWSYFPKSIEEIESALEKADAFMSDKKLPFAFVLRKGDITPYKLNSLDKTRSLHPAGSNKDNFDIRNNKMPTRNEALKTIQSVSEEGTAVIATTGFTGRELCMLDDRDNQLYMVGSMGCALSIGIGIAINKPALKVIVVDGDGALLMRTGSMAATSMYAPANLIHILFNNEIHESTGGQQTLSGNISFPAIAKGFGYNHIFSTDDLNVFNNFIFKAMVMKGPIFIHLKTHPGVPKNLGRPSVKPEQVKERFMKYLDKNYIKEIYVQRPTSSHIGRRDWVPS